MRHPSGRRASLPSMDDDAIVRARERLEASAAGRVEPAAVDAALERAREQIEALANAAAELESSLPERVGGAVQDGVREQVLPVARNLAEIRGLMNQVIHRLDRLEGDAVADRHARVDDLALLVDLITAGWKSVDGRLGRIETIVARLEQGLQERGGAIVYRIEDHRPDAADST
jgi:hypothetical protein